MMDRNPFAPPFEDLPEEIPLFPISGVLLMPNAHLPLNIFEPRYKAMVKDAMAAGRIIGMIQPKEEGDNPALYNVGCAGKITEFKELEDGRFLISLAGICRFKIEQEIIGPSPYRCAEVNWDGFDGDVTNKACLQVDRERLQGLLATYFEQEDMSCDFSKFNNAGDGKLITCLSMACPFEPAEKQALIETVCCADRAKLFMNMLEMAVQSGARADGTKKQCH